MCPGCNCDSRNKDEQQQQRKRSRKLKLFPAYKSLINGAMGGHARSIPSHPNTPTRMHNMQFVLPVKLLLDMVYNVCGQVDP